MTLERVAGAVLGDGAGAREREVVAADHGSCRRSRGRAACGARPRPSLPSWSYCAVPARIGDHERRHIGGVVRDHELARARRQMERAVAGRVAGRADEADAGRDLGLAGHLADVLPGREHGLDAAAPGPCALPAAGRSPPGRSRTCIPRPTTMISAFGIDRLVGVLLHQPEDVVGMEMRDQDGVDLGGIDAGRLHVGHRACRRWAAPVRRCRCRTGWSCRRS